MRFGGVTFIQKKPLYVPDCGPDGVDAPAGSCIVYLNSLVIPLITPLLPIPHYVSPDMHYYFAFPRADRVVDKVLTLQDGRRRHLLHRRYT